MSDSSRWQHFLLRVVVGSAIAVAFFFTTGFGSIVQTFAIGITVSLGGQAAVFAMRRLRGDTTIGYVVLGGSALVAAAAAIFVVVIAKGPQEIVRFRTVDKLMEYPGGNVGPFFKVHGFVEAGSIQRRVDAGETYTTFALEENGKRIAVEIRGPIPDTFRDGAEIVATGRLRRTGSVSSDFMFAADEISAKCPSTYSTADGPRPATQFR
jgi:cytochrome c-type biogenesis protein CcmE